MNLIEYIKFIVYVFAYIGVVSTAYFLKKFAKNYKRNKAKERDNKNNHNR